MFVYDPEDPDNWIPIKPLRAPTLAIVRVLHTDSNKIIADRDLDAPKEDAYLSGGEEHTYIASLPGTKLKWCFWIDERDSDFEKDYTVKIETIEEEKAEAESNFFLSSKAESDSEKKAENTKLIRDHAILSATLIHETHDVDSGKPREVAVLKVKFSKWLEGEKIRVEVYEHNSRKTEPIRDANNKAVNGLVVVSKTGAYFYTADGKLLGNWGSDTRVLVVNDNDIKKTQSALSSNDIKNFKGIKAKQLSIEHKIFISLALTAFGEPQYNKKAAWAVASSVFNKHKKLKESGFGVYKEWTIENTLVQMRNELSDKKYLKHNTKADKYYDEAYSEYKENAIAGVINADLDGIDYSNGAIGWQGKDIYSNGWAEDEGIFVPETMSFFGKTKENKNSKTLGFKYKFEGTAAFSAKDSLTGKSIKAATLFYKPTQESISYFRSKKAYPNPKHRSYGGIAYPGATPLKID